MAWCARYLLISLLVVMLPLRGWAGNVMAVDMVAAAVSNQAKPPAVQATAFAVVGLTQISADCMMSAQSSPHAAPHCPHCGTVGTFETCDTCDLCLAVVNPTVTIWSASQLLLHSSPLATDVSFTSASSASHLKPPIA